MSSSGGSAALRAAFSRSPEGRRGPRPPQFRAQLGSSRSNIAEVNSRGMRTCAAVSVAAVALRAMTSLPGSDSRPQCNSTEASSLTREHHVLMRRCSCRQPCCRCGSPQGFRPFCASISRQQYDRRGGSLLRSVSSSEQYC